MNTGLIAINNILRPLSQYLKLDGVTELCVNNKYEIWLEKFGKFEKIAIPELSLDYLENLADIVATYNNQEISVNKPLLSGNLPAGERIEIVRSPATQEFVMSIRRQQVRDLNLEDYELGGAFFNIESDEVKVNDSELVLIKYYKEKNYKAFLKQAIISKKNILISGGTGTGKTTFLNACLKEIPKTERIITVEDNREVIVSQPNCAHLLAPRKGQGTSEVTTESLFESCLRLRPDRIFLSEIRGGEVFAFLEAINSGHPGSLSTIHADHPKAAFEQIYRKMRRYGDKSERKDAFDYLKSIINVVVQLKRCPSPQRHMYVSEIYYDKINYDDVY